MVIKRQTVLGYYHNYFQLQQIIVHQGWSLHEAIKFDLFENIGLRT
jgi:hypothetical protein